MWFECHKLQEDALLRLSNDVSLCIRFTRSRQKTMALKNTAKKENNTTVILAGGSQVKQ